jgi:hypothetical protein
VCPFAKLLKVKGETEFPLHLYLLYYDL